MSPNDTGEIHPPEFHVRRAESHVQAAKAARMSLLGAYASSRPSREEIAALHQEIGFGLKLAEIHALLALALAPTSTPGGQGQVYLDLQEAGA